MPVAGLPLDFDCFLSEKLINVVDKKKVLTSAAFLRPPYAAGGQDGRLQAYPTFIQKGRL